MQTLSTNNSAGSSRNSDVGDCVTGGSDAPLVVAQCVAVKPKPRLPHPHFGWACLWSLLIFGAQIFAAIVFVMIVVALVFIEGIGGNQEFDTAALLGNLNDHLLKQHTELMVLLATGTMLMVSLAVAFSCFRRQTPSAIGWRSCSLMQWIFVLLLVVPQAIIGSELANCFAEVLPMFGSMDVLEGFSQSSWPIVFILACLLPGLGEEIFFRGFLSRGLVARHGVIIGAVLASLFFAVMHLHPIQVLATFVLGLGIQCVFLTTRSLPAAIVLHTLNNTLAFALMKSQHVFPVPGLNYNSADRIMHTPWLVLLVASGATVMLYALLFYTRTRWILPDGSLWNPGYYTTEVPPAELAAKAANRRAHVLLVALAIWSVGALLAAICFARSEIIVV